MIGFLFNLILVAIFVYLLYRVIAGRHIQNKDPYKNNGTTESPSEKPQDPTVQKKIDMSDVEDADYKEVD